MNELENTKCEIVYNGIHKIQIHIDNGLPQGHNEGGPTFNTYTNSALKECLKAIKTLCYNCNVSALYYADDGLKICLLSLNL